MNSHQIRKFTPERLHEVRNAWNSLAGEDEFEIELAPFFDWCQTHIEQHSGDSHACELHNIHTGNCDAIIELVDSPHAKLSKLLKLFISPEMWNVDDKREQVVNLYVNAFIQVIGDGWVKGAKHVKLYARTSLMLSILHTIHAKWPAERTKSTATFQGRWLTLTLT